MRTALAGGRGIQSSEHLTVEFLEGKMILEKNTAFAQIVWRQIAAGSLCFLILVFMDQSGYALAVIYGLLLMVVNAWWLSRRLEKTEGLDVQAGQRSLYAGAAVRFVALIAGLLLAHLIGLHLLAVAAGMFVAQAVVFIVALIAFKNESKGEGLG